MHLSRTLVRTLCAGNGFVLYNSDEMLLKQFSPAETRHFLLFNENVGSSIGITGICLFLSLGQWHACPQGPQGHFPPGWASGLRVPRAGSSFSSGFQGTDTLRAAQASSSMSLGDFPGHYQPVQAAGTDVLRACIEPALATVTMSRLSPRLLDM